MKRLKLHRTKGEGKYALVDDDVYEIISWYPWVVDSMGYPKAGPVRLHSVVMPDAPIVDHINRDKLDNRRSNLRGVTKRTNAMNTSSRSSTGYKNVYQRRQSSRPRPYFVTLQVGGKTKNFGSYETIEKALIARDRAYEEHGYE